ncbi:DUF4085 family protein [Clostridium intestinale]|uniref:Uncharacterized protein n=1 Tax=Clostridium intestinale DSM 6191 TaxID=1121320 RepID=A0A1M6AMZ6_9CLOT|nr:DUF4085 family protein [Clostridium intestinale]SHI37767.1 Protein of unknown function [Clostridium intestinale DSM 6191]
MNYFNKEWCESCQRIGLHLILEEDKQAEIFSEEYFQQLYNQKLIEFLDSWKEIASITNKPFDKENLTKQFEDSFIYNQEYTKKLLPQDILIKIADIRVYVLNKATHQVINDVALFCEYNKQLVERTIKQYNKHYKKVLNSFNKNVIENIHFHDCIITDIRQSEESLSITFDNSNGFTDIYEVQFHNYKLINQDNLLKYSWWLHDEIYITNGKYELQVLLENKNSNLVEFSVYAEHISFKRNQVDLQ